MKISYDKEIDAKYISIKKGKIFKTHSLEDWLILDLNKRGDVLGVEVLNSSKNKVTLFTDGKRLVYLTAEWNEQPEYPGISSDADDESKLEDVAPIAVLAA